MFFFLSIYFLQKFRNGVCKCCYKRIAIYRVRYCYLKSYLWIVYQLFVIIRVVRVLSVCAIVVCARRRSDTTMQLHTVILSHFSFSLSLSLLVFVPRGLSLSRSVFESFAFAKWNSRSARSACKYPKDFVIEDRTRERERWRKTKQRMLLAKSCHRESRLFEQ